MKRLHLLILIVIPGLFSTAHAGREVRNFNADWRFALGDPEGAHAPGFDAAAWRVLDVPHDWAFEADYAPNAAQTDKGGYKPGGVGWYRKAFTRPLSWRNKRVRIEFDGVYMNSEVWINGHRLGKRPYGYISFAYDLNPHLKSGMNTVAVRVDNSLEPSARWYHGCGIHSHVRLVATDPVCIAGDGVYITTPGVSAGTADVLVETELVNTTIQPQPVRVGLETVILDPGGGRLTAATEHVNLQPGATGTVKQSLAVPNPLRWDTDTPHLYSVVSRVSVENEVVDEITTRFGIRTLRWDTNTGFWLNEKNVKLLGVCDHSEAGPIGAAYPNELLRWKIQLLKDMGCNAIRTAHNPQTPVFYDLCDEMGMLVMDEIFDGWKGKAPQDYGRQAFAEWWERDLRAWLKRDRNHPCVFVWSLGNETGGAVAPELVKVCHEMDPSRLVTSGHSGTQAMDIEGVNGHSETQHFFEKHKSEKPFVSTEAPHTWQVRGYYRSKTWYRDGLKKKGLFPCPDLTEKEVFTYDWTAPENRVNRKQVFNSSYDNAMVRITARKNWERMRDLPWHSGHFRWTGFDYIGEAGYVHGGWPFRAFMGGALDLAGFKKDLYFFYQSQWTDDPMVHILPHWTHPKMEAGTEIPVWVYSNCDEVELFLNGKSQGKDQPGKKWDEMQCDWMVPWKPGTLEAVGFRKGKAVARARQVTAGAPAGLDLQVEGSACPIITVTQVDDKGVGNPYAENRIHYHLDGPGRVLSLESGNPVNTENNYGQTSRTAFFGLARAFLQTTTETGDISIVAGAICGEKQLMAANKVAIDVRPVAVRGALKVYDLKVLYSTDGSEPAMKYTRPFAIQSGTTVKADVYNGNSLLFSMTERFGPGEGLYWGTAQDPSVSDAGGDQAENAHFEGAKILNEGKGFHGKGYLDFGHNTGAFAEWYQENDGSAGTYNLVIRYSGKSSTKPGRYMKLTVNGNDVKAKLFFPNTGGWGTDWRTLEVPIKLNRGANRIRLGTIERGGMYLDEISVE